MLSNLLLLPWCAVRFAGTELVAGTVEWGFWDGPLFLPVESTTWKALVLQHRRHHVGVKPLPYINLFKLSKWQQDDIKVGVEDDGVKSHPLFDLKWQNVQHRNKHILDFVQSLAKDLKNRQSSSLTNLSNRQRVSCNTHRPIRACYRRLLPVFRTRYRKLISYFLDPLQETIACEGRNL